MFKIGCHLSIASGYLAAAKDAVIIGANTFQFFSRNPRGGAARGVNLTDINAFLEYSKKYGLLPVLAHGPYTLNAGSATPVTRGFARDCLAQDLSVLEHLKNNANYVFHPGSHTTLERTDSIGKVIDILNGVLVVNQSPIVLLESMSGKGSELGNSFDELKFIIDRVDHKNKIGICIDTCHIFCAGYDIKNDLDGVLEKIDNTIGMDKVFAVHLNDSVFDLNSKKDRHAKLGEGYLGLDAIIKFINHKSLRHLSFYLETPNDLLGYKQEIAILKKNYSG